MAQVLKEDIKQRIYSVDVEEFYNKGYKTVTIRKIAQKVDIPTGLVYSIIKINMLCLNLGIFEIIRHIKTENGREILDIITKQYYYELMLFLEFFFEQY